MQGLDHASPRRFVEECFPDREYPFVTYARREPRAGSQCLIYMERRNVMLESLP